MDNVTHAFLAEQKREAERLNARTDLVQVKPAETDPVPTRYLVDLRCRGFARTPEGEIGIRTQWVFGIRFPEHYLWRAEAPEVLACLTPNLWAPNVLGPYVCMHLHPGMPLAELVHSLFDLVAGNTYALHSALNRAAADWYREHLAELPVDPRPLVWRKEVPA